MRDKLFSTAWKKSATFFHSVEIFFPQRGKITQSFSIVWKSDPKVFPLCGKIGWIFSTVWKTSPAWDELFSTDRMRRQKRIGFLWALI